MLSCSFPLSDLITATFCGMEFFYDASLGVTSQKACFGLETSCTRVGSSGVHSVRILENREFLHFHERLMGCLDFSLDPGSPMIPLYGSGDLTPTMFIHVEVNVSHRRFLLAALSVPLAI
ncbi:hypothetical protein Tco_0760330 [Tanacetum coccineum]